MPAPKKKMLAPKKNKMTDELLRQQMNNNKVLNASKAVSMRKSPGAFEDAITIAKQQGAKTNKQINSKAKIIVQNRINDSSKTLTRAKNQSPPNRLLRGTTGIGIVSGTKKVNKPLSKKKSK
jgi:hypothetical protein